MFKFSTLILLCVLIVSCNQRPRKNTAFYINVGGEPSRLNPVGTTDAVASSIAGYVYESLLVRDIDTYEYKTALAESWSVSEDKMKFTFKLKKGIKFHDGVEFTAKDVKFSFDIYFMDKFNTIALRSYFEGIKEVRIINDYEVEFIAKDQFWQNFDRAAGLKIFPKHFYERDEKKSFFNKHLNGTGPYKLALYARGSRIVLDQNKEWWGRKDPVFSKEWQFEKLVLRFVSDTNVALEMLKKGSLDYLGLRAEDYVKKTSGKQWGKSVHKVKTFNKMPKGYSFIAWNMKHPILKDLKVRKALYHLVNRELMIEKFEFGYSVPAIGPVYPGSPYASKDLKPVKFNPKYSLELLRAAGWSDTDGDNILDKVIDGKKKKLSITIMEPWEGFMKYLTIFKEDAKKAGVEINIKLIEWNSFVKLLEERKFEAVRLAWSVPLDWNPIQIWHTDSFKGGSNFIGFSDKKADELMTKAKFIHDRAERIRMLNKVEKIIVDKFPYVWFSYKSSTMYGHSERTLREKESYNYSIGTKYWQFKNTKVKDL